MFKFQSSKAISDPKLSICVQKVPCDVSHFTFDNLVRIHVVFLRFSKQGQK
jgi:hypothetical protein